MNELWLIIMVIDSFSRIATQGLTHLTILPDMLEEKVASLFSLLQKNSQYKAIVIYLILLILIWRIFLKFCRKSGLYPIKFKSPSENVVKIIQEATKDAKDNLTNFKPKVPQVNFNLISIPKKIEGVMEKVKEIQEMHSIFQTEVIESHLSIFKILNNGGDKDYLRLPETELVEPDSALPPLENEE